MPENAKLIRTKLRDQWYLRVIDDDIDLRLPGIYEWRIGDVSLYVGKAKVLRSRLSAYPNNVRRMLNGLHWHGNPLKDYRLVHHELRRAYENNLPVTVVVLENCDASKRAEREQWWIDRRRKEALAGGPRVLN